MLPIVIGFDPRESLAYHVCCQSIIEHASEPVCFIPLASNLLGGFDGQRDGSNAFIFSRFLVPYIQSWTGWALYIDGDMIVRDDVAKLFQMKDEYKAAMVVKHVYESQFKRKYIGTPLESDNIIYPRKNWSSVILWNCAHYANRKLKPEFIAKQPTSYLHRFEWITDDRLGELPVTWNYLETEYAYCENPKLVHQTLGMSGIPAYADSDYADEWHSTLLRTLNVDGVDPAGIVKRAQERA